MLKNFGVFANSISADDPHVLWQELLEQLVLNGNQVGPRGKATSEFLGVSLLTEELTRCVIWHPQRKLNYRFMVAEALWIATGRGELNLIERYNSKIAQFSDDGKVLAGAYGPRLAPQWDYVIETLRRDPHSRQAVATIWTPSPRMSKDMPCTISLQFIIRDERLHVIANMRSSDVWLGLPYDIFTFSFLGICVAAPLRLAPGQLLLNLGSSHLYHDHYKDASEIVREPMLQGCTYEIPLLEEFPKNLFEEYEDGRADIKPLTDMLRARTIQGALTVLEEAQAWILG
jgi:thymidylate synthase